MKKLYFIVLLALSTIVGYAENDSTKKENHKLIIGVHGGVGNAMWYGNAMVKAIYVRRASYLYGITYEYQLKRFFALKGEINYERKGASIDWSKLAYGGMVDDKRGFTYNTTEAIASVKPYLDYVTVPLMVKFTTYNRKVKWHANIGMYTGYLARVQIYIMPDGRENPNNYKRWDIGLAVGGGMNVSIKKHFQFSVEARNNLGFLSFSKVNKTKNESFALLFGLAYKI